MTAYEGRYSIRIARAHRARQLACARALGLSLRYGCDEVPVWWVGDDERRAKWLVTSMLDVTHKVGCFVDWEFDGGWYYIRVNGWKKNSPFGDLALSLGYPRPR